MINKPLVLYPPRVGLYYIFYLSQPLPLSSLSLKLVPQIGPTLLLFPALNVHGMSPTNNFNTDKNILKVLVFKLMLPVYALILKDSTLCRLCACIYMLKHLLIESSGAFLATNLNNKFLLPPAVP